jgi:hypothetical protein
MAATNAFKTFNEFTKRYEKFLTFEYSVISQKVFINEDGMIIQSPLTVLDAFIDSQKISIPLIDIFKQRPEHLSLYLYGFIDLWSILLHINGCKNHKEFMQANVFILDPELVDEYMKILQKNALSLNTIIKVNKDSEYHLVRK